MVVVEPEKHYLECKDISYMTAIPQEGSWFTKIYKPPSVFQILKNVTFTAHSGEIHAIVGVAESGKSTLLESLTAGVGGDIGGIAMLDKFMLTKRRFNKYCSFCNYRTRYPSSLPIRSLLYYHARLYLSSMFTSLEIDHRINELMGIFDIIGYSEECLDDLTISAKRRVLTVVELLKDPVMILLDDPIANLSPLSAYQLIYALQYYTAKYNRIMIISLRHVRSDLYHLLGSATFLFYGQVAYTGPMNNLVAHFSKAGYDCPKDENPAAYYLSLLTVDKETMESVMETHEIATSLISFHEDQLKQVETVATNTFLENSRKPVRITLVFRILLSRFLAILSSSPRTSLNLVVGLPMFAILMSIIALPESLFFWNHIFFLYLVLQFVTLFPIYSEVRNLSYLELPCYSQSTSLIVFLVFFLIFTAFQAFLVTGILIWSTSFNHYLEAASILLLLSIFGFSLFSITSRHFKKSETVFFIQTTIILLFNLFGNRFRTSSFLQYTSMINPFTYSNYILSTITSTNSSTSCDGPKYYCSMLSNLHTDLYPSPLPSSFLILSIISMTYLAISIILHLFEPSVSLQKHMKYY